MTTEQLQSMQDEIAELAEQAKDICTNIADAESCETDVDFEANLQDAIDAAATLLAELNSIKNSLKDNE